MVVEVGGVVEVSRGADGGASFFLAFKARAVGGGWRRVTTPAEAAFFAVGELPPLAFASTEAAARALQESYGR